MTLPQGPTDQSTQLQQPRSNKVPVPNLTFWSLKILTTGLGETSSDFLVKRFPPELAVGGAFVVLVALLIVQIRSPRYQPARYWTSVLLVSVFGTMVADALHVVVGIPYIVSAVAFALVLAAVFATWWWHERSLSIHGITTVARELFYWTTIVTTFALGTALGDLTAATLGLGYLTSAAVFAIAFALPGVLYGLTRRGPVVTFWVAYILTRPLGASFADFFAVARSRGGLALGTGPVSLALIALFAMVVAALTIASRRGESR